MSNINEKINENINLIHHTINKYFPSRKGDDDIFQVGLIALWKAVEEAEKKELDCQFSTFAITRIKNAIIDEIRRETAQKRNLDESVQQFSLNDDENGYDEIIGRGEIPIVSLLLDEYCDRHAENKKSVIVKLMQEGYDFAEIVDKTGMSKSTVYNLWKKIKEDLKNL